MFGTVLLLPFLVLAAVRGNDEASVTAVVLGSLLNTTYGGDAVAAPKRAVLLGRVTIAPSREQLEVHVFSPANEQPTVMYREARAAVDDLRRRSTTRRRVRAAPPGFSAGTVVRNRCGPRYDAHTWRNAVAVSRPGFAGNRAVLYVEIADEGRAYLLERVGGGWKIVASVELWACG